MMQSVASSLPVPPGPARVHRPNTARPLWTRLHQNVTSLLETDLRWPVSCVFCWAAPTLALPGLCVQPLTSLSPTFLPSFLFAFWTPLLFYVVPASVAFPAFLTRSLSIIPPCISDRHPGSQCLQHTPYVPRRGTPLSRSPIWLSLFKL